MNPRRAHIRSRRAFTLIEAIASIVIIATIVPTSVLMLRDATTARIDAVQTTRATWFATAVAEQIKADAASTSPALGTPAFADANAYLNTPSTGLYARLSDLSTFYNTSAITYTVTISTLVSDSGTATGNVAEDIYRYIQVNVVWSSDRFGARQMTIGQLIAENNA